MTMVTPTHGMPYTIIPMDRLDEIRKKTHEEFRKLPDRYTIRTFYIGPRAKKNDMHVLKSRAIGAKIGIYKVEKRSTRWNPAVTWETKTLIGYV